MNKKRIPLLAAAFLAASLVALSLTLSALTAVQAKTTDANITIGKTADPVVYSGSTANFTITITNTSGTTLTNVVVTDPLAPLCNRVIGDFSTTSIDYTCSLAGQTADFTNNVTVTGILSGVGTVSDTASAFVQVINPGIDIAKTAAPPLIYANQTAYYTYTVSNLGDDRLSAVSVTDNECAPVSGPTFVIGNANSTLDAGEVWAYTCSTALSDDTTNTAIVTATDRLDTTVNDSAFAFVEVISPSIRIDKTANPTTIVANQTVVYTYTVTNPGDDGLSAVEVSDDHCSPVDGPTFISGNANNILNPGEVWAYNCTTTLGASTTNTAIVTGTDSLGGVVNDSDTASVNVIAPSLEIAKTPDLQTVNSGDDANFVLTVSNQGDVELSNVAVADPQCDTLSGPSGDNGDGVLQPTETWTYNCTVDNVIDGFINSATVTGETPTGGVVSASDAAKVILSNALTCPTDMLAYWKFDEVGINTSFDDYYNGLDARCTPGSCPSSVAGMVNNAQTFDGDEVNVPVVPGDDSFNWGVNDSFSFEFWMQRPGMLLAQNEVVVGRQGPTHPEPHIWVGPAATAGTATFCLSDNSGVGKCISGDTVVTGGAWHHVVAVRDANEDKIHLYVDGKLERSADQSYSAGFETTTALNIGWLNLDDGYHFSGSIDELTLYNKALSLAEVQQHYHEVLSAGRDYCADSPLAPMIYSTPVTAAAVQRPYTYDVDAIGNPVPTYALTVNPAGMTIDPATGMISWQPVVAQQGSHPVAVEARNSAGTDVQNFTINVAQGPLCPAGMISYWQLDETSGTSYADFYNDNDGACPGGAQCPNPVSGQVNGAQTFDGTVEQINVPAFPALDWAVNDSFSIEFWMLRPGTLSATENEVAVGKQGPNDNLPHIWVGPAGTAGNAATFCLRDTNGTGDCVSGTTVVTGGAWHHVVAVRDAGPDLIRIYVDGVQEASVNQSYTAGFGTIPPTPLNIGWLDLDTGFYFLGSIDEVALYDRALSATEIQQHYNRGLAGYGYCVIPDLAIAKQPNSPAVYARGLVTYTYTVTNTGDDLLSSVSVSDDQCSPVALVQGNTNLSPDESSTYQCATTLNTDTTNVAVAQATPTVGGPVSATATAFVDVINPEITIDKLADPTKTDPGGLVTYTYTVANAGDDPLSNVSVNDDRCSPVTYTSGDGNLDNVLDLVEIWTYVCSMNLFEDTTNTATVTANDSLGGPVNDSDTAFVEVSQQVYLPLVLRNK